MSSTAVATDRAPFIAVSERAGPEAPFLRIDDLVKDFGGGTVAVDHVSLDIAQGEIFALLGSSGCGKTTLLRMLAGFETPTSGRILLGGRDISAMAPYDRPFNMMFQSYALFPHLSVADNIAFGLRRDGLPKAEVAARVDAMLKLVQLTKFAARKPHQLSGGQQQRVALARSLAKRPQMLLLDEPLGALDKKLREETQIELVNIIGDVGVTCVMVTHDQEEAMTMASRIAVMSEGRVLQVGPPDAIYETPATRFVADFIGSVNLMEGRVSEASGSAAGAVTAGLVTASAIPASTSGEAAVVACADCTHSVAGHVDAPVGAAVWVAIRPEKISLRPGEPTADASPHNHVRGTVKDVSYFGSYTVHHLRLASGAVLKVSESNVARERAERLVVGDIAWAHWSPTAPVVLTR